VHPPAAALRANLWRIVAFRWLFWTHFFAAVLVPFFTDWAGLTLAQTLTLNAWFMGWNFVLEVPTGAVADRFGRKWSLALGAAVATIAPLVYVSTRRLPVFLVAEVLFAVAYTLVSGADEALAYDTLDALGETGMAKRVLARLEAAQLAGIVTGALAGSVIAARWGLAAPFACQAAPAALAGAVALGLHEPGGARRRADGEAYLRLVASGVRHLRRHPALRALVRDMVGFNAVAWTLIWLYQPLARAAGLDPTWFGPLHATLALAQIGVLHNATRLDALVGSPLRWLRVAAATTGVAFLGLGTIAALPAVLALIVLAAAVGLTRAPLFASYLNRHIDARNRATVLSTVSMLRTVVIMVGNVVVGRLADWSLHGTALVLGAAALVLAATGGTRHAHLERA